MYFICKSAFLDFVLGLYIYAPTFKVAYDKSFVIVFVRRVRRSTAEESRRGASSVVVK